MKRFLFLLLAGSCAAVWAQTNALKKPPVQPTEINSDSGDFDMNARRAVYLGHVKVIDPKLKLTCERLVVDLPQSGGRLSHVSAETNVVIDFKDDKGENFHVTSDKAVYAYSVVNSVTNDTVTWTGNPIVKFGESRIFSEPLIWDRAKGHFKFGGGYKVILDQHLDGSGGTNVSPMKLF